MLIQLQWFGLCSNMSQPIALPVLSEHPVCADHHRPRDWAPALRELQDPAAIAGTEHLSKVTQRNQIAVLSRPPGAAGAEEEEIAAGVWEGCLEVGFEKEEDNAFPRPVGGHSKWKPWTSGLGYRDKFSMHSFPISPAHSRVPIQAIASMNQSYGQELL